MEFFKKLLRDAVPVLQLDKTAMLAIATNKSHTLAACGVFIGPHLVNFILAAFTFGGGFKSAIFSRFLFWPMVIPVIALFTSVIFMSIVAKKWYSGRGENIGFFRVIGYSSMLLWLSVFPFFVAAFGLIDPSGLFNLIWVVAYLWMFVVAYKLLHFYHGLTKGDSATVVAIGVASYIGFQFILGYFLVGSGYRFFI